MLLISTVAHVMIFMFFTVLKHARLRTGMSTKRFVKEEKNGNVTLTTQIWSTTSFVVTVMLLLLLTDIIVGRFWHTPKKKLMGLTSFALLSVIKQMVVIAHVLMSKL
eukprot:Pompholyxophrys_punicea_v1_NODE_265_length_2478_cov_92.556748.p2 type:complete len:107 gc:universal NODE_265_length_2478_cov_92.556748:247-567(+)